jgi:hypothetical protein
MYNFLHASNSNEHLATKTRILESAPVLSLNLIHLKVHSPFEMLVLMSSIHQSRPKLTINEPTKVKGAQRAPIYKVGRRFKLDTKEQTNQSLSMESIKERSNHQHHHHH